MRVDIKSKNEFNAMIQQVLNNKTLPFITGCSINSKNIKTGDIFFPLRGEKFDGHSFIDEAIMNGASLIIAEKKNDQEIQIPNIYVNSVLDTIKNLAKRWRMESNCEIIGITGSNGKTSTKEILSTIISKSKSVMFSKSNYNSTVGLPMSMFEISMDDDIGILEMGANKCGEIKELTEIATPNHGLVTNISNAHNKYFGSINNIAKNKIELLKSIPESGFSFINMDDSYLREVKLSSKHITYGFSGTYDFTGVLLDESIQINNDIINLPYSNMALAQNYLAAYAVLVTFGIDNKSIIKELENMPIYPGRGELINKNGIVFIDDTYNSNFASCANGIDSVVKMIGNKKILVLGDMHELGDATEEEHIKLGRLIDSVNINAVFGFGDYIKYTLDAIKSDKILKIHCNDKNELTKSLKQYHNSGDIIYVKGSRCMKMEEIIYGKGN